MSKEFHKYNSLVNVDDPTFVNNMIKQGLGEGEWVAIEKIHGSNFGLCTDGSGEVWHCTRTKRLGEGDSLKGSSKLHKYDADVLHIYNTLKREGTIEEGDQLIIRGELFGGNYFGTSEPNTSQVQKGMSYHPDTEFMVADVEIYKPENGDTPVILSYLDTLILLVYTKVSLKHSPEIASGTLTEMLKVPNEFESKVPEQFGLVPPEGKTSPVEGIVIKPVNENKFMKTGKRCILKSKNSTFNEKGGKPAKVRKEVNLSEEDKLVFTELTTYINTVRLESVLSKLIEYSWADFNKVLGLLIQDAKVDYESDKSVDLKADDTWSHINKLVTDHTIKVIREYFNDNVGKY